MIKGELILTLFVLFGSYYYRSDIKLYEMKRPIVFILLNLLLTLFVRAQSSITSAEIYLRIKKLNVLGSVLYLAANPDDENTRLLTYFSKDKLYRTGYLS